MDQLKLMDVRAPLRRVLLVVPVLAALLFSWFATRWYVGNFVAEFAPQIRDEQMSEAELASVRLQAAQAAVRLAPNDPWTHWVIAGLKKMSLAPDDLSEALKQYEEAVRLSPNDYRFWMDLGRTREQAGDAAGGEKALRRAVELAPSYAYPRWYLGNLLLRAGRGDEAFDELRRAAAADPALRPQIFNAAGAVYGEDVDAIKAAVGGSSAARAELVVYLAGRGRFDDALRVWSGLSAAEKKEQSAAGESVMSTLLQAKHYHAALDLFRDFSADAASIKAGEILNPGYEADVDATGTNVFGWKVTSVPQAQIAFDEARKHGGSRSLRVAFKSPSTLAFKNISQLVVVEPGVQYRLEFYVRTEELKSAGTPTVEIVDGSDNGTVLAATQPLPGGTHDWQAVLIDFKTLPGSEAVIVRVNRASCGADTVCPIFGIVWYDDFNLQRIGGPAGARDKRSTLAGN
jgi:tetratricopeptide (TPR) repeat protein